MVVGTIEQPQLPTVQPFFTGVAGALGAAAVSAGIADELANMAVGATEEMAAQGRGAAIAQALGGVELFEGQGMRTSESLEVLLEDGLYCSRHMYI
jgi:hypothetical protein